MHALSTMRDGLAQIVTAGPSALSTISLLYAVSLTVWTVWGVREWVSRQRSQV